MNFGRWERRAGGVVLVTAVLAAWPGAASAAPRAATLPAPAWFVQAAATAGGDGSMQRPFATLADAERSSSSGDTITVLPSTTVLDGGIALKPRQKLLGAGGPVVGLSASAPAPRITNSTTASNHGDAVVLADAVEVANIAVAGSARGGIYGANVADVNVHDNDLTATNASCATGFVVQPFVLPAGLPGVGVPFSAGLPNGWAAVMVDADHLATSVTITANAVHDGACGDGIDVRASGTADVHARITGNSVTRMHQGLDKLSVLGIGMQTRDTARLEADVRGNTETYIGDAIVGNIGNADSEGVFANGSGRSHLVARIDKNVFAHGLGHLSANCVEAATSNGGPTLDITLTNSTCYDVVGDILEAANLSPGATLNFTIDHVRASHATYPLSDVQHPVVPGDDGDCMLIVASGAGNSTSVKVSNSTFTDCAADGIGVASAVAAGSGPIKRVSLDVRNSTISANHLSNLRVLNITGLQELAVRVEHTNLSASPGTPVIVEQRYGGSTTRAALDLGGGALGSTGGNCIYGGAQADASATKLDLSATGNWWGSPGGPRANRLSRSGGAIAVLPASSDPACGPKPEPSAAPKSCKTRRQVTLTIKQAYRRRLLSAEARIAGRRIARFPHGQFQRRIDLRGRPAGRVTVVIAMRLKGGRRATDVRHYRLC